MKFTDNQTSDYSVIDWLDFFLRYDLFIVGVVCVAPISIFFTLEIRLVFPSPL